MLSKQLNKASAEQVTIVVKNVDGGGTITTGLGVALVASGASCDGVSAVIQPATTMSVLFAGIAKQNIPVNGYGNVVCWGYADSVKLSNAGTSITITIGDTLYPSAVAGEFYSTQTGAANVVNAAMSTLTQAALLTLAQSTYRPRVILAGTQPNTVSATTYGSAIIRAL